MGGKKKWIDKNNAQTFRVVHRSLQDPLGYTDDTAPKYVLDPIGAPHPAKKKEPKDIEIFADPVDDEGEVRVDVKPSKQEYSDEEGEEELFDDEEGEEEDEEDHNNRGTLQNFLPREVFASKREVKGPRIEVVEMDPDILEALNADSDDDDVEELDDDFILQAQKSPSDSEEDRQFQASIRRERLPGLNLPELDAEHREILEAHFKKLMAEYDDEEIGDLEDEQEDGEIQGGLDFNQMPAFEDIMNEFITNYRLQPLPEGPKLDAPEQEARYIEARLNEPEELVEVDIPEHDEEKWDAETIVSTYSNLENHPRLIDEDGKRKKKVIVKNPKIMTEQERQQNQIILSKKLGIPLGILGPKPAPREKKEHGEATKGIDKEETPEQKKERKKAAKEGKKASREKKKAMKDAFQREQSSLPVVQSQRTVRIT